MDMRPEDYLREERQKRGLPEPKVAEADLDQTVEHQAVHDRAIRAAGPEVRRVRNEVFGSPEPPFSHRAQAVEWVNARARDEEKGKGDLQELRAAARLVSDLSGGAIVNLRWPVLRVGDHLATVPLGAGSSLTPILEAAEKIHTATGLSQPAVAEWILLDTAPHLPRVIIQSRDSAAKLAGKMVGRRSVTLEFNGPLREADFRRLFRQVRVAFEEGVGAMDLSPRGRRGPVVTSLDRHLATLVERTPDATWDERAASWRDKPPEGKSLDEWKRGRHGLATPDALRIRYRRYQRKLDSITSIPKEEPNA